MSQRSRLVTVFITTAAILSACLAIDFVVWRLALKASHTVAYHRMTIERVRDLVAAVADAETGQRGYLLTGKDSYLEPYDNGVAQARILLAEWRQTGMHELSVSDVTEIATLVAAKLEELSETITLRRTQGLPAAQRLVETNRGKRAMDALRLRAAQLIAAQESTLDAVIDRAADLERYRTIVFAVSGTLNLLVLLWAFRMIRLESASREAALLELHPQKGLVDVTLMSIGDAVIVTDNGGRITLLNEVAEQLTGWKKSDAIDQPCGQVFHNANETTREVVESPVDVVLRLGTIAGLATHTLLIRKDGSEIPIDDSVSPVKDAAGRTLGVVLIFRDVAVQRTAEHVLVESNRALAAANAAKDQFRATLSHELRTPLTPVLAVLTAWESRNELPAAMVSDVRMMRRNIQDEARLIDDLLDHARIATGKLSLNPEMLDLHEVMRMVIETARGAVNDKSLELSLHFDAADAYVEADRVRMQQIFANILNNAIKFTPAGGRIDIMSANDREGRVSLTVADTGIGMGADILQRLFQPFEQDREAMAHGGLGLGMAIAKALVGYHQGAISAESAGPGKGSTFTVSFATAEAHQTARAVASTSAAPAAPRGAAILIAEDHVDTAEVMTRLLCNLGHQAESCGTLAEALVRIRQRHFDLIITDVGLPDGTGIELLHHIREQSSIPAIAMTGYATETYKTEYEKAGFNGYLTKPVSFDRLDAMISQLLQAYHNDGSAAG